MENLRVRDKEKIESIIKAGKDARIYAVRKLPINLVIDLAVNEEDKNVLDFILQRLEGEKQTQEVVNAYDKLLKVKDKRFIEFTAKVAPIEAMLEMALTDEYAWMLELIYDRLEEKHKQKVMSECYRLSKLEDFNIRKFVIKVAPISMVIEMAVDEKNENVLEAIYERFKKETTLKETVSSCEKLYKSRYLQVRAIILKIAPITTVIEIALTESVFSLVEIILERFEKDEYHINYYKGIYFKLSEYHNGLSKAMNSDIRKYIAKKASISVVIEMALKEKDCSVEKIILERLENPIYKENIINACEKLSKSERSDIRKLVAKMADIDTVIKMAVTENDDWVSQIIVERLESEKDTQKVINACEKLYRVRKYTIRRFVAKMAPISVICKMALFEDEWQNEDIIVERLHNNLNTEEGLNLCKNLLRVKSLRVREFIVRNCPINFLLKMQVTKRHSDLVEIILERLKPLNEIKEVRIIYNKICKYSSKCSEHYIKMNDDELIEVIEAEGDVGILKLVDEISN